MTDEQRYYHIKVLMDKRARLVLSSGASASASASGGAGQAAGFAGAFLEALRQNEGVLEASALYHKVNQRVSGPEDGSSVEFAAMKWARNDLADFFFVPAALR
jgi:hypothetical protein